MTVTTMRVRLVTGYESQTIGRQAVNRGLCQDGQDQGLLLRSKLVKDCEINFKNTTRELNILSFGGRIKCESDLRAHLGSKNCLELHVSFWPTMINFFRWCFVHKALVLWFLYIFIHNLEAIFLLKRFLYRTHLLQSTSMVTSFRTPGFFTWHFDRCSFIIQCSRGMIGLF